ncbi:MAG: S-layer y protein [Clostridia bacterium]|nr:S-layer y protein [Clostridia bacterium]
MMVSVLVLYTVSTFGAAFKDVPASHWAYTAIADMQKRGFMLSNSAGEFSPNSTMNYFEAADVAAKATGYVDVKINQNVDTAFKQQILNNYATQKPILASYEAKYKAWDKRYNEQIAYLLGRGYLKAQELDKFITKGTGQAETRSIVTKEEFAVFVVRILGKEETAKSTYKVSGFSDDSLILAANKPYVGYLKALGLVNPDAKGNYSPKTQVTRAWCAKLISDTLTYKEKTTVTQSPSAPASSSLVTVTKVMVKEENVDYWVLATKAGKAGHYAMKNTVKVTDKDGQAVSAMDIPSNTQAIITTAIQGTQEYIISMKLQSTSGGGSAASDTTVISGTIARIGTNGGVSIFLADESTKTYLMDTNCVITLDGLAAVIDDIKEDDAVKATIVSNYITKLQVTTSGAGGSIDIENGVGSLTSGEVMAKGIKTAGYFLSIKQGTKTLEIVIDEKVILNRNDKTAEWEDVRIGDQVKVVKENGNITELAFTGTRTSVTGQVKAIYIAAVPEVTVITDKGAKSFVINGNTEIYDYNQRANVSLRDLRLGQDVEILIDSKEVISLVIQRGTNTIKYKGIVQAIGKKSAYIDVLVDYDPISEQSKVIKRVQTPLEVTIELDGKTEHRTIFDKGMDVVITYKYMEDVIPEKILIIE